MTSGDVEDIALVLGLPLPRVQDALRELADAGLVEMRIDK
ncbi:MAG: helix-turn-helix domain-containing protein [Proteobacteria bacterium]|nr:helix-turn-helix domain-containing protein [Pseudomonadota bacterium]